jgi:hypothetical protein
MTGFGSNMGKRRENIPVLPVRRKKRGVKFQEHGKIGLKKRSGTIPDLLSYQTFN